MTFMLHTPALVVLKSCLITLDFIPIIGNSACVKSIDVVFFYIGILELILYQFKIINQNYFVMILHCIFKQTDDYY